MYVNETHHQKPAFFDSDETFNENIINHKKTSIFISSNLTLY